MAQNSDSGCSDEPKSSGERVCNDCERDGQHNKSSVELSSGGTEETNVQVAALQLADTVHATDDKQDDKGEQPIGEQGVYTQHDKKNGIIAGEVAQVEIDPVLDLAEVLRLGELLEVEELGHGLEVGKATLEVLGAHAIEAALQVEARSNGIERDVDTSSHGR